MAAVVVGALLLAASWAAVAVANHVPRLEARLFETVNDLPDFLWRAVWAPMQIGSFVGSLVVVAIHGDREQEHAPHLGCARREPARVLALEGGEDVGVPRTAGRPSGQRSPPRAGARPRVRLRSHRRGVLAGHGVGAIAPSPVAARRVGRRSLVAFARVYAGAHLPLDVVGGAGLGILRGHVHAWAFGLGGEGLRAAHPELDEVAPLEEWKLSQPGRIGSQ